LVWGAGRGTQQRSQEKENGCTSVTTNNNKITANNKNKDKQQKNGQKQKSQKGRLTNRQKILCLEIAVALGHNQLSVLLIRACQAQIFLVLGADHVAVYLPPFVHPRLSVCASFVQLHIITGSEVIGRLVGHVEAQVRVALQAERAVVVPEEEQLRIG
jgi:hypothetical protein